MKNRKKFASSFMVALLAVTACGCKTQDPAMAGKTIVEYWTSVATEEAVSVKEGIQWYNDNNTDNIYISYLNKPAGNFDDALNRTLTAGVKGPDIFTISETGVKAKSSFGDVGVLENLQPYVDADPDGLSGIYPSALSAYRYNRKEMTVNANDPLYALPISMSSSLLAYNATALKKQGIIVISLDIEDIEDFNHNGGKDNYGKTKEEYGIQGDVRPRGFDRWDGSSVDNNYVKGYYSEDGKTFTNNDEEWKRPEYDENGKSKEQMIFNNRIAMSWDEAEDLGRIMTKYSAAGYYPAGMVGSPSTEWGYYTRYWFMYGWTVGGAACKYDESDKNWKFTVGETNRYCALMKQAGTERNLLYDANVTDENGKPIFVQKDNISSYTLGEGEYFTDPMPSQYQAFERFFYLQKPKNVGGLYIGPRQSADIGGSTELAFFTSGKICMYGQFETSNILSARKAIGDSFEWDVAPAVVYKAYDKNGNLVNKGAEVSYTYQNQAVAMWNNSDEKEASYKVIKYLASGEYQKFQGELGLRLSPVESYNREYFVKVNTENGQYPRNVKVFVDTLPMRFPDENTYFPDAAWVTTWAQPLNSTYRESGATLDEFLRAYTDKANEELRLLKQNVAR